MKERLQKEKDEAEPLIKDDNVLPSHKDKHPFHKDEDNMQIVSVTQKDDYVPEEDLNLPVDQLLSVKNWTMQSHDWKLFNAIFELLNEDQLLYKCPNGKTIFQNFAVLLKLALTKSDTTLTKDDKVEKPMMT